MCFERYEFEDEARRGRRRSLRDLFSRGEQDFDFDRPVEVVEFDPEVEREREAPREDIPAGTRN